MHSLRLLGHERDTSTSLVILSLSVHRSRKIFPHFTETNRFATTCSGHLAEKPRIRPAAILSDAENRAAFQPLVERLGLIDLDGSAGFFFRLSTFFSL